MSEQSLQIIDAIRDRIKRTAQRRYLTHFVYGAVILLGVLAGLWLFFTALEAGFWFTSTFRVVLFGITLVLGLGVLLWFVIVPLLRFTGILPGTSETSLAQDIGSYFPQVADRLINLLHLAEGKRSSSSPEFINHAVQSLSRDIEHVEFEKMESYDKAVHASKFAAIPILGLLVFLIAAPNAFLGASNRLISPGTEFSRPALFQMQVVPGSIELLRGDSLQISITLTGEELPSSLLLRYQDKLEEKIVEEPLFPDSTGTFTRTFVNVRRSFIYSLQANTVATPWYDVEIVERPIIRSLQVSLESPSYSRIPEQRLDPNVGDVQALPGTRVNLEAIIGGPNIEWAFIEFDNGQRDTLAVQPNGVSGTFTLTREGTYHLVIKDANGTENSNPIRYSMKLLQDAFPTAVLISPEPISELNETLSMGLASRITDDFGFNRLRLYYRLAESRFGETMPEFEFLPLSLEDRATLDQDILFNWDLGNTPLLDPVPGDAIEYYVQVWDNDAYSGFKSSKSPTQLLRLPSLAEQFQDLEQQENEVQDEMEELLRDTREIDEQFKELQDELRNKLESDWEDQRQLEQIKEKQAELESKVESLNDSFEEMTQQMEDNNLSSDETQQLYEEMQQVLEEINSPELMDALNQLQEAMQELNLQQMQESLNNFEFNEQQYQDRLERSLELFKQIRVQQDLDEVAKRAEELAEQQEQLQEATEEAANESEDQAEGEQNEGEQNEGEQNEGEQNEGEQNEGEQNEGEQNEGEQNEGEQNEGEQNEGEQNEGEQNEGEQNEGEQQDSSTKEQLAQQQEMSKEEMEAIEQKMEEILQRMDELDNAPSEQMEQLNEQVQDQQIPEQMQENADQLRQEEFDQAQQQQQQMQQQLQQMQQQLQQMQQGMQGAQMQINLAGLRRALSDILTLSQQQEGLRENVRGLATDSPIMRQLAQEQVELSSGLRVVSDSLQALSKKIPQMSREVQQHAGDALREMSASVESMTDRVANRASGHQKESMMHLNELALLLSDLLNEMMNQQGSGGGGSMSMQQMIQQLQNAAGQQQKLNQQIQQMLNESQGNRLSQDMQQRLRQMAAQQEQIRSQIKQLSRNRELKRDVMGDLDRIANQMEETIRELQRNRPGRRTVERQQEILTRLLEATKSMQQRGREKKREGQIGEEFFRESPDALTPGEESDRLRRALIEALESGYAPDYEELIKKYFELLQEQSQDVP